MPPFFIFPLLLTAVVFVAIGVGPFAARLGGWAALTEFYAATGPFEGGKRTVSGAMGLAHYGFSLQVGADRQGLSLEAAPWLRAGHRPLFIPWGDMACREQAGPFYPRVLVEFQKAPGVVLRLHKVDVLELKDQAGTSQAFSEIS